MRVGITFASDATECHKCRVYAAQLNARTASGRWRWAAHVLIDEPDHPDLEIGVDVLMEQKHG